MPEGFAERLTPPACADMRLLADFTAMYCRGRHRGRPRSPLTSAGTELGVYRGHVPAVCEECAELLRYGERRRVFCPKHPKPFCSHCDTHCYRPEMRERMRDVMRYAGPRSLFTRHAADGVRHVLEGLRMKKKTTRPSAGAKEER